MPNFSKTIGTFFRSNADKYTDFVTLLKESDFNQEWLEAVTLYRKGVLALQKNESAGVDIIKKANDTLKRIISSKNNDTIKLNLHAFNESIETFEKSKDLDFIKFNFGILYESCKTAGYKSLLNESAFYEDEGDGGVGDTSGDGGSDGSMVEEEISNIIDKAVDDISTPSTTGNEGLINTKPDLTTPETMAPIIKKSGYHDGFEAGKVYVEQCASMKETKFGHSTSIKEAIKEAITTHLHKEPYNYVESWQRGFKEGSLHQEEVHKELYPEDYKKYLEISNQEAN